MEALRNLGADGEKATVTSGDASKSRCKGRGMTRAQNRSAMRTSSASLLLPAMFIGLLSFATLVSAAGETYTATAQVKSAGGAHERREREEPDEHRR